VKSAREVIALLTILVLTLKQLIEAKRGNFEGGSVEDLTRKVYGLQGELNKIKSKVNKKNLCTGGAA
jgi:hypothetical protein